MSANSLPIAVRVIAKSDREHPADAVLHDVLKSGPRFSPERAADVARCVFAFFRWRGWILKPVANEQNVRLALRCEERFGLDPTSFTDADLVQRSVPDWIRGELTITPALARAFQSDPVLWLRARNDSLKKLHQAITGLKPFAANLPETFRYTGDQDLFRTPEFHQGLFELQDLSSQAVSLACAPQPGETWWDACAGEGGKTLHLSALMQNKGLIWATDRAAWRLQHLKRRAARASVFNYRVAPWDGGAKLPTRTKFHGVLVDAPCTGVGTWQRNPHARWTLVQNDVTELAEVQKRLLLHAAASVKPGGKLVYAVCTLTRSETEVVADYIDQNLPGFAPHSFPHPLSPDALPTSRLTIMPQDFRSNGMFIAAWVRR